MTEYEDREGRSETPFVHSRRATFLTMGLVFAQLSSCVAGVAGFEPVSDFFICVNPEQAFWFQNWVALIWVVLIFSWVVGIVALPFPRVRPIYWSLVALIPLFAAWQQWMVAQGHYSCRFHI